ncbi:hypothetical protein CZ674_07590 [Agrococcus casei LMG 22410]|uniref:Uncharacterized protein n=1 Tax=Agrococcus casei LMG 22410 TaxID=1255656 RepID=A0A1R4FZC3_9MICO|nr:hypothetical protein CZ674_07590 [Agrococcus casei LMG 22410]
MPSHRSRAARVRWRRQMRPIYRGVSSVVRAKLRRIHKRLPR